jgi:hypothetical protein
MKTISKRKFNTLPEIVFEKVPGTVDLTPVSLPAGNHTLRLYVTKGGVKIAGLTVLENATVDVAPVLPNQTHEPWDFSKFKADAVVINQGQNDHGQEITNEFFTQSYVTMME